MPVTVDRHVTPLLPWSRAVSARLPGSDQARFVTQAREGGLPRDNATTKEHVIVKLTTSVRRRLVGAELRRYRESAGHDLEDAAFLLDCDKSKISRIETGDRGIRAAELRALLTEYGVPAADQEVLLSIAWQRGDYGDWAEFRDVLPGAFLDYLIVESAASEIITYQPQQVPPLLQTEAYARAVIAASADVPASWRDKVTESVLARQRIVLTEREPPVDVLLAEGALRQPVGSRQVMRAQLARLAHSAANDPHVTIRVIPHSAGANPGIGLGSPTLIRLGGLSDVGVVHLAGLAGGTLFDDPATVRAYSGALGKVKAAALPPPESAALIAELTRE
jgi:transcriptional regulator with XRE-family HTH domain